MELYYPFFRSQNLSSTLSFWSFWYSYCIITFFFFYVYVPDKDKEVNYR